MLGCTVYLTEVNDSYMYVATAYKISYVLENEKYIKIFHYSFNSFQIHLFI